MPDNQESPSKELEQKGGDLSDKLDNCPFCDAAASITSHEGGRYYLIKCGNDCCCKSGGTKEFVTKLWNTRAPSKQLTTTQQALDSAVEALEWRPIETAPKGVYCILTFDYKSVYEGKQDLEGHDGMWFRDSWEVTPPIAWMPLPKAALASIKE